MPTERLFQTSVPSFKKGFEQVSEVKVFPKKFTQMDSVGIRSAKSQEKEV